MPLGLVAMIVDSVFKGTALLLVAFMVARALLKAPAAARHLVWAVALVGVLVIPALSRAMPWKLEVLPAIESSALVEAHTDRTRIGVTGTLEMVGPPNNTARWSWKVPTAQLVVLWAPLIWLLGVGAVAVRIAISFGAIRWMLWRGASANPGDGDDELGAAQRALGLTGPVRLMVSRLASIPFTTGTWRPVIVLPPSSTEWDRGLRRTVLLHELSHIKRRDALIHLVSQAACAIYWFHPSGGLRPEGRGSSANVRVTNSCSARARGPWFMPSTCCRSYGVRRRGGRPPWHCPWPAGRPSKSVFSPSSNRMVVFGPFPEGAQV